MLKQIFEPENENIKSMDCFNLFIADDYKPSKTSECKYASFLFSIIVL